MALFLEGYINYILVQEWTFSKSLIIDLKVGDNFLKSFCDRPISFRWPPFLVYWTFSIYLKDLC